jgi:RNA polymerase sigma factor (sigma-70 family)
MLHRLPNDREPDPEHAIRGAEDLAIVRRALAGDDDARRQLLDRLVALPAMVRGKHARMGAQLGSHEVEDVTQSVLLSLWAKLARFDGRAPLLHWAYGFCVLGLRKAMEHRQRNREHAVGEALESQDHGTPPPIDAEALHAEVRALEPSERQVVELKHFEALTFEEIGARLGMITSTAKTKYYRALARLRDRLRPRQRENP